MTTGLTGAEIHTGSWGTPDLGVTELLQGTKSTSPQTDWGSLWNTAWNAGYNNSVSTTNPYVGQAGGGYDIGNAFVLGQAQYKADYAKSNPTTNNTNPIVKSTSDPTVEQPTEQQQGDLWNQVNAIYQPNANYLNQAEATVNSQYPSNIQSVEDQYAASKGTLDLSNTQTLNQLTNSENQATRRKTDAWTAATRLYNELMRGGHQRYGGASSAGEAFAALAGVEQQRTTEDISKNYETTMGAISSKRGEVAQQYSNSLFVLDTQKRQALDAAKQNFDDKMLEITRLRSMNESAKQSAYMDALTQLRSQIQAINLNNTQFLQKLQLQKLAYDQQLDQTAAYYAAQSQAATNSLNSFNAQTTTNPVSSLNSKITNQNLAYNPTGSIRSSKDDAFNLFS